MSEASEALAERIENLIGHRPGIRLQKMFGGTAFMLHGNMLVGPMKDGNLMVRVGPELYAEALDRPGADEMKFTGRSMKGFVTVAGDVLEDDETLAEWIALAERFVGRLPAK